MSFAPDSEMAFHERRKELLCRELGTQDYVLRSLLSTLKDLSYRLRIDGRTLDGITKDGAAELCDRAVTSAERTLANAKGGAK